jgi:hypothetical protein
MRVVILFVLLSLTLNLSSVGQGVDDMMVIFQTDLVKTDNINPFQKAQFGVEFHYFALSTITANAGLEIWRDDEFSFTIGARWYPANHAFVRMKALIGENDLVVGGGWITPLSKNFYFEATGDFYFKVDFAIRAGFVYVIPRN